MARKYSLVYSLQEFNQKLSPNIIQHFHTSTFPTTRSASKQQEAARMGKELH